jgi:putative transposase
MLRLRAKLQRVSPQSESSFHHVWFSTKRRKSVLHEVIRSTVLSEFLRVAIIRSIEIVAMEAIEDHVHLLLQLKPGQNLSTVMHDLKGASARTVFHTYPELKLDMHSDSFWQKSYGARPVPPNQVNIVRRYILTQESRPLRHE